MDLVLTKRIYVVFKKLVDMEFYGYSSDTPEDKQYEEFIEDAIKTTNVSLLIAIRRDLDDKLTFSKQINEDAYKCFKAEFSLEEFPEIYL